MKILIAGDTHMDLRWWRQAIIPAAQRHDCTIILQLGDFGYWEHTVKGARYLHDLSMLVGGSPTLIPVFWIRGNHENQEWLQKVYQPADRFVNIRPDIWYIPDGLRWTWGKHREFLSLGGGHSIDRDRRIRGVSWWPDELITDRQYRRALTAGRADVLVCHDAPAGFDVLGGLEEQHPETDANRAKLAAVVASARPSLVFHGHWHWHHVTQLGDTTVIGLDCNDGESPSMAVLDTETMDVEILDHDGSVHGTVLKATR